MSSSGVDLAASKSKCLEDLLWDEKKKVLCWQKIGQESGGSENYPFSHNLPCLYFPSLFVPKSLGLKHRLCRTIPGADSLSPQLTLSPRLLFFVGFSSRSIITYQSEPYVFSPLFPSSFSFCFSRWGQKLYSTALCVHLKNHPKDLSPINTMHWGCFDFLIPFTRRNSERKQRPVQHKKLDTGVEEMEERGSYTWRKSVLLLIFWPWRKRNKGELLTL